MFDRLVDVGQRLRFDALRRVDDQQRALARGEAAADLVGEIDVARRVHQVELVGDAVLGPLEPDGLRLDGDPALALDIHIVEHLRAHLTFGEATGRLDQAVGERRLPMVDMGNNTEISDEIQVFRQNWNFDLRRVQTA